MRMKLPVRPPMKPMLSALATEIPEGKGWLYEPKWDGFRTIVFFDGEKILMQSRDLKPLGRYFPELESALKEKLPPGIVVDGEIVIATDSGLDFDALLLRIHPAASRIQKLASETPSSLVLFDILAECNKYLMDQPFKVRRKKLEKLFRSSSPPLYLTPATTDIVQARDWFSRFEGAGLDGIIAKSLDDPYMSGDRSMVKIKHKRTADCVVGGFRWNTGEEGTSVGSLLLGLYDGKVLHHVGHTSSFTKQQKRELVKFLKPYRAENDRSGFGKGRTPGEPSRWTSGRDLSWIRLRPKLVCEVSFDHFQGDRFRHAATFLRWRFDKPPRECTYDQFTTVVPVELKEVFQLSKPQKSSSKARR
jgi:ATP-dependent DNA ligase